MAELLIQDSRLHEIADGIRDLTGSSDDMSLTDMVFNLSNANSQINSQATQMNNIQNALNSVSVSGDNGLTTFGSWALQYVSSQTRSITFKVGGQPSSFLLYAEGLTLSSTQQVVQVTYDGSSYKGIYSNTSTGTVATNFNSSYSNGILTITSSTGYFLADTVYYLCYTTGPVRTSTFTSTASSRTRTLSFTGLSNDPWGFYIMPTSNTTLNRSYKYALGICHLHPMLHYWGGAWFHCNATTSAANSSGISYTYNNGTLQVTLDDGYFYSAKSYQLIALDFQY